MAVELSELLAEIERWRRRGERVALATVVATRRSAPRPVGSKLAMAEDGELAGSVSGGCVESDVCTTAREVLASGAPRLLSYGISDELAGSVGLPCGGEIDVLVEPLDEEMLAELARVTETGERAVLFTQLDGEPAGAKLLVREDGTAVGPADSGLAELAPELLRRGRSRVVEHEAARVFAEVLGPPPRLVVFGAGDTAEALCRAARTLGWRTILAEARRALATSQRVPSADRIVAEWPQEALASIEPGADTAVVVLTHDEKFDLPALAGALASDAFYVGAIGSRRTQQRRRERLLELGVGEPELARLHGPCGLDIGAESPAETAISILAEILAVRASRAGGPLRESAQRIHADREGEQAR